MLARLAMAMLLACVTLVLPVAAHAGECQAVIAFFDGKKDVLDVVNLTQTTNTFISFAFFNNNGLFAGDTAIAIGPTERLRLSADTVYSGAGFIPPIADSYVRIRLSPVAPFSASIVHAGITRELACVNP